MKKDVNLLLKWVIKMINIMITIHFGFKCFNEFNFFTMLWFLRFFTVIQDFLQHLGFFDLGFFYS